MFRFALVFLLSLGLTACDPSSGESSDPAPGSGSTGDGSGAAAGSSEGEASAEEVGSALDEARRLLEGIQDAPSAEAAKGQLETLVRTIERGIGAVGGLLGSGAEGAGGGLGQLGDAVRSALPSGMKESIEGLHKQIGRLLDDAGVRDVIGDLLGRLQSALPQ